MKLVPQILLTVFTILLFSCISEKREKEILVVGNELINVDLVNINSTQNIVFIGDGLKQKIKELKQQNPNINFQIELGDLDYPYGNFKADNILTLDIGIQKVDVRLKYNLAKDKFDILGFKTEDR